MNLRQHKRIKISLMHFALFGPRGPIGQYLLPLGKLLAEKIARDMALIEEQEAAPLVSFGIKGQPLVQVFREAAGIGMQDDYGAGYTVVRKKDQVVVGTFDTLELAQAEVDKAKRAKKATLEIL